MKRWLPWLALPVLACLAILLAGRSSSPNLLQDSDTAVLLQTIRERQAPLSWFGGDWPLKNHFYRPVSTLVFEADNALYGDDAAGYGLTNALLCAACVLLLFWFVRELTDVPWMAGAASGLFGLWHVAPLERTPVATGVALLGLLGLVALVRGGRARWGLALAAGLTAYFLSRSLDPVVAIDARLLAWIPGRTASTMTVFALIALAAYARFERLAGVTAPTEPSAMDVPATRGTAVVTSVERQTAVRWVVIAFAAVLLALGSYEQAVMLPACLVGVALIYRFRGVRAPWWPHALFWGGLVLYLVARTVLVPTEASGYQTQQFRSGPGVALALVEYLAPGLLALRQFVIGFGGDWVVFLLPGTYVVLATFFGNATAYVAAARSRDWPVFFGALGLAFVSFLPMAWLQHFDHYHYWPAAMRAVMVVALAALTGRLLLSAVSPPGVLAPPRPHPAPGSLPRP